LIAALLIAGGLATVMHAGEPPSLLDDNRGNLPLAAINLALNTVGFFADPLTATAIMIADAQF